MAKNSEKLRVAVIYGGKSGEHEISQQSAFSVISHLDKNKYDVIPIGIDKNGQWLLNQLPELFLNGENVAPIHTSSTQQISVPQIQQQRGYDVVFPVLHGPLYEDGCIQGLLRLAELPFVGAGVLSSAISMDKDIAKRLVESIGIPVAPSKTVYRRTSDLEKECRNITTEFDFPLFVKPASCGSSLGTHRVESEHELLPALKDALRYDHKALVEKAIDAQEIELAVLENPDDFANPLVSIAGEIATPDDTFYSYEAKYLEADTAKLMIPAQITSEQLSQAQNIAKRVFATLECEGMARVDLFLDRQTQQFYFNEVNTLPGFTTISMYPKLWQASGISYSELLTKLIDVALASHERNSKICRTINRE